MAITTVPNRAALIQAKNANPLVVEERPIPTPGEGEILVRNYAVAVNPVDWKIQDYGMFVEQYPNVLGSDVAGKVVSVGPGASRFKPGDRVTGFSGVIWNQKIDHGAFQTYTILNEFAAAKIPESLSFEDASVLPMGIVTAMAGLLIDLHTPETGLKEKGQGLLVWGASSSVGISTVQMATHLGYTVFATGSPKHHATIKAHGAKHVFDYNDADVESKIADAAKAAGVSIKLAFDSISAGDTFDKVPATLKKTNNGGRIAIVLPWPENKPKTEGIETSGVFAGLIGIDQQERSRWVFHQYLEKGLADGSVQASPKPQVVGHGLEHTQEAWNQNKAGVSGVKLVVQVP